ncbi:MAG: DUF6473 family protein [Pseudomonadota bacterium]
MSCELTGLVGPDLATCAYGMSRLSFRGPKAREDAPYMAFLGANETFAPFVERCFAQQIAESQGVGCVNLGQRAGGIECYLRDVSLLNIARQARAVVIEVPSALNLSNAIYKVHPRRNDRFVGLSDRVRPALSTVDLTEVHFTGHLARTLAASAGHLWSQIVRHVQATWVASMQKLLDHLGETEVHLLWLGRSLPPIASDHIRPQMPDLVTRGMMDAVAPMVQSVVEFSATDAARAEGVGGMVFAPQSLPAAELMWGAAVHREIASAVQDALGAAPSKKARA